MIKKLTPFTHYYVTETASVRTLQWTR